MNLINNIKIDICRVTSSVGAFMVVGEQRDVKRNLFFLGFFYGTVQKSRANNVLKRVDIHGYILGLNKKADCESDSSSVFFCLGFYCISSVFGIIIMMEQEHHQHHWLTSTPKPKPSPCFTHGCRHSLFYPVCA